MYTKSPSSHTHYFVTSGIYTHTVKYRHSVGGESPLGVHIVVVCIHLLPLAKRTYNFIRSNYVTFNILSCNNEH